jgi:hypothetical protein
MYISSRLLIPAGLSSVLLSETGYYMIREDFTHSLCPFLCRELLVVELSQMFMGKESLHKTRASREDTLGEQRYPKGSILVTPSKTTPRRLLPSSSSPTSPAVDFSSTVNLSIL